MVVYLTNHHDADASTVVFKNAFPHYDDLFHGIICVCVCVWLSMGTMGIVIMDGATTTMHLELVNRRMDETRAIERGKPWRFNYTTSHRWLNGLPRGNATAVTLCSCLIGLSMC